MKNVNNPCDCGYYNATLMIEKAETYLNMYIDPLRENDQETIEAKLDKIVNMKVLNDLVNTALESRETGIMPVMIKLLEAEIAASEENDDDE